MRISDWSSDVCSSDLPSLTPNHPTAMANQNKRKNILLIVVDQWRGDMLSYLGTPGLKTPNLDMLCREGVTFRNHFTQAVPCGPARASLLTGLYQMTHRAVQNTIDRKSTRLNSR